MSDSPDSTTPGTTISLDRLSARRRLLFRAIAVGVPTLLGGVAILVVLFVQQRLVFDDETGRPSLQSPPIFLEEPGHEVTGHRYLYDPRLGWRNIPGWEATTNDRELRINSLGLRDREHPYEKPAGVRRILVLGDSFAWGYGVSNDEIFSAVLERRLVDEDRGWEVLNAGVSGWGTDQSYLFLTEEGFDYDPDVVVLAFFSVNDPVNNVHAQQYGLYKPVFRDASLETLLNVPTPAPHESTTVDLTEQDPVGVTAALIRAIAERCRDRGCEFVLLKFGDFLHPEEDAPHRLVWEAIEAELPEDLAIVDWDDRFLDRFVPSYKILRGNDDGHWNAAGHAMTAEILHDFLLERGLLDAAGEEKGEES